MSSNFNKIYEDSLKNPEEFWKKISEDVFWFKKPTKILNKDNPPFYKWFTDGVTNTCYNALDVHIDQGRGDKIALIATARHISKNKLEPAIKIIDSWGLKIKLGKNIFKIKNQFAGDDFQRASDLQDALDDESIKAIFCVRGGYGLSLIHI